MSWILILSLILIFLVANLVVSLIARRDSRIGMEGVEDGLEVLYDRVDQMSVQKAVLTNLERKMEELIGAEVENQTKKGEANRTLRRRVLEQRQSIEQLLEVQRKTEAAKNNAVKMCALLHEELNETRKFLEEAGVPTKKLTRHMEEHFKGNIPGVIYANAMGELDLRRQIAKPLSGMITKQPDDAA